MSAMIDIIGATILAGMVMLIIFGVTANLNQTLYTSTFTLNVQTSAVALAREIEYDFTKMGYNIDKTTTVVILIADSTRIRFKADILNAGIIDTIGYWTGSLLPLTRNPRDMVFTRQQKSPLINSSINANLGVTNFSLTYYDSLGTKISTPVVSDSDRRRIKSIKVKLYIESPEPVSKSYDQSDTSYIGVNWEKLIYPRNL